MAHSIYPFKPYFPKYNLFTRTERYYSILRTFWGASKILLISRYLKKPLSIGASLEITDRCNAGCSYCYVYPKDWDQGDRIRGYLNLSSQESQKKKFELKKTIDRLSKEGKVLVTLVGGEPTLASDIIDYASKKFPVVWIVTNGAKSFPKTPPSVVYSVSVDGPPNFHNTSRDPSGFFANHKYGSLHGLSAAIVRNINMSKSGAYVHITLNKKSLSFFPETVHWLCNDVKKLRGIMVSGAATTSLDDPFALQVEDRKKIKAMIESLAEQYGWRLFPFNQPTVNSFLFDKNHIIYSPSQCTVARRVESLDFAGNSTGKCILRDEIDCQTCMCNLTGLMKAVSKKDIHSIKGLIGACFG